MSTENKYIYENQNQFSVEKHRKLTNFLSNLKTTKLSPTFKMPTIKLQSSDDEIFEVDNEVAKCSGTIRIMLGTCGTEDDIVPLPNVNSTILRKVIEWANYHKTDSNNNNNVGDDDVTDDDDVDDNGYKRTDNITPWDENFVKSIDQGTLFELIMAANYLNIKGLLQLCCKAVANMIKGKSPEDIRQLFNIKNDFSPAEEALIRKDNAWYEENNTN